MISPVISESWLRERRPLDPLTFTIPNLVHANVYIYHRIAGEVCDVAANNAAFDQRKFRIVTGSESRRRGIGQLHNITGGGQRDSIDAAIETLNPEVTFAIRRGSLASTASDWVKRDIYPAYGLPRLADDAASNRVISGLRHRLLGPRSHSK